MSLQNKVVALTAWQLLQLHLASLGTRLRLHHARAWMRQGLNCLSHSNSKLQKQSLYYCMSTVQGSELGIYSYDVHTYIHTYVLVTLRNVAGFKLATQILTETHKCEQEC